MTRLDRVGRFTRISIERFDRYTLDVFNGGRVLTREDCQGLVRNSLGSRVPFKEHYLANLTPRQVVQRVLHNLKAGALQRGDGG